MEQYKMKNVSKVYGQGNTKFVALNRINLKIKKGDFVVILGPSGSGKSTLLNLLSGIDKPTKGEIWFENKMISKYNDEKLRKYRKRYISFIFQNYHLIPCLNVKENIELSLKLTNQPILKKEVFKLLKIENLKNKYPYQLSGGEMQRVAIARAIIKNPQVLFCDEPTGALDEKNGKVVLSLLKKINYKYKTTIILVTHNPSIVYLANQVIYLKNGKIEKIKYPIKPNRRLA